MFLSYKKLIFYFWVIGVFLFYYLNPVRINEQLLLFLIIAIIPIIYLFIILFKSFFINNKVLRINIYQILVLFLLIVFGLLIINAVIGKISVLSLFLGLGKVLFYTILALLQFLAFFGLGAFCLKIFKYQANTKIEHYVFSTGIGIGMVIFLMIALGWLGLLYPLIGWLIIGLSLILGISPIKQLLKKLTSKQIEIKFSLSTVLKNFIILAIFFILAGSYLINFLEIYNVPWDALHTYLLFPKAYVSEHGIVNFPYWPGWGFPQNAEMFFTFNWLLGGITLVFISNFFLAVLSFVCLIIIFKKIKNIFYAVALFLTMPFFYFLFSSFLNVEIILFYYLLLTACAIFLLYQNPGKTKYLIFLAIFFGICLGIKYTNLFLAIFILLVLFLIYKNFKIFFKKSIIFVGLAFLLFSPWLLKNYIYYQQPIYPMFPGKDIFYQNLHTQCQPIYINHIGEEAQVTYLNRDYDLTKYNFYQFIKFFYRLLNGYTSNNPGPWLFMLLPLLFFIFREFKKEKIIFFLGLFYYFWILFNLNYQIRYIQPAVIILVFYFGYILSKRKDKIIDFLFLISLVINFFSLELTLPIATKYLGENLEGQEILTNDAKYLYQSSIYINQIIEKFPDNTVWSMEEFRGYWINDSRIRYIPDIFIYLYDCLDKHQSIDEFITKFKIKYLWVAEWQNFNINNCQGLSYCESRAKLFNEFLKNDRFTLIKKIGNYYIYQVN